MKCENPTCSSINPNTPIELGQHVEIPKGRISMALDTNGNPRMSFYKRGLLFIECRKSDCSSNFKHIIDGDYRVGQESSIAIDADNKPIISYFDGANYNLKVAKIFIH